MLIGSRPSHDSSLVSRTFSRTQKELEGALFCGFIPSFTLKCLVLPVQLLGLSQSNGPIRSPHYQLENPNWVPPEMPPPPTRRVLIVPIIFIFSSFLLAMTRHSVLT